MFSDRCGSGNDNGKAFSPLFGPQDNLDPDQYHGLVIGLNAVVVATDGDVPRVLVVGKRQGPGPDEKAEALPFGPFHPQQHRTLDAGLRSWVEAQTGLSLGYVEQLYTFGDRGRDPRERRGGARVISIGYLALTREPALASAAEVEWRSWYSYFPWEDWREGRPAVITERLEPDLSRWAKAAPTTAERRERESRISVVFGMAGAAWSEELVLERYELLYEAGLVEEAPRDQGEASGKDFSRPMALDHRRILATAIGRLRGKIKYRPVVFELMPETFTLFQLQRLVEALSGKRLHKQNFRRLVEKTGLVESTGKMETQTGGRPAQQFRFRHDVLAERAAVGVKLPSVRQGL